ncbi:MAG: glycosyltransferase [Leptolyngbyaceae cyanobacterium SL_7_1]|nr:glycosyltransferase [Leptolyngbyaceae cyanobacterium SL_7_1]
MKPQVTVVVAPRERFSCTDRALESLYKNTSIPFKHIYVDGNSPRHIKRYLEAQAKEKGFHLIRTNHYITPNHARNLAIPHVDTPYVVFIDNDLVVLPGWLEKLMQCAEETGAWVVGPLYLEGEPEDGIIHMAGGDAHIREVRGGRRLAERHRFGGQPLEKYRPQLRRELTELVEFHCAFMRMEVFDKLGLLDEAYMSLADHIDLCLSVLDRGESIYFEPDAVVCYLTPPPFALTDIPYYLLRWSDEWNLSSVQRLKEKWDLAADDPFLEGHYRWGVRHRRILFKPVMDWLKSLQGQSKLSQALVGFAMGIVKKFVGPASYDKFREKNLAKS